MTPGDEASAQLSSPRSNPGPAVFNVMAEEKEESWAALSSVALREFTSKKISILLSDSSRKEGWVHAVDPVTRTVVLEEENEGSRTENSKKLTFVLGHAISRVVVQKEVDSSEGPRYQLTDFTGAENSIEYSKEQLVKRKEELIDWLTRNSVPVTECSENSPMVSVMGVLFVEAPYDPDCCICSNEIILDRIQKLIRAKQDHDK